MCLQKPQNTHIIIGLCVGNLFYLFSTPSRAREKFFGIIMAAVDVTLNSSNPYKNLFAVVDCMIRAGYWIINKSLIEVINEGHVMGPVVPSSEAPECA